MMLDDIDKIALASTLPGTICELNHGVFDEDEHPAVDFIVIPMGQIDKETGIAEETGDLVIPVCKECQEGLLDDEWALLYCLGCSSSHWVIRSVSGVGYKQGITYFTECPHCKGE